ncbi:hypothetical protein BC826DRAFT_975794 [Russula brevipes]|nr:hypothetical protein BC826DRAFT_975794 [Russula brevipes]
MSYLGRSQSTICAGNGQIWSTEAIARRKQTRSINIFVPQLEFTKCLDRKQTSTSRNEKQRLYASVLRSTGRRKTKKSEKRKQIAEAKTTLMPPCPSGCLVAMAVPIWTSIRPNARSEADALSKVCNWRWNIDHPGLTREATVSTWMKFAEKVQGVQRLEYKAMTDACSQGQKPNLCLLIGLTEQEELAIQAVDAAVDGQVETWAEPYILSGLESGAASKFPKLKHVIWLADDKN